jgi:hypothetical protein
MDEKGHPCIGQNCLRLYTHGAYPLQRGDAIGTLEVIRQRTLIVESDGERGLGNRGTMSHLTYGCLQPHLRQVGVLVKGVAPMPLSSLLYIRVGTNFPLQRNGVGAGIPRGKYRDR